MSGIKLVGKWYPKSFDDKTVQRTLLSVIRNEEGSKSEHVHCEVPLAAESHHGRRPLTRVQFRLSQLGSQAQLPQVGAPACPSRWCSHRGSRKAARIVCGSEEVLEALNRFCRTGLACVFDMYDDEDRINLTVLRTCSTHLARRLFSKPSPNTYVNASEASEDILVSATRPLESVREPPEVLHLAVSLAHVPGRVGGAEEAAL